MSFPPQLSSPLGLLALWLVVLWGPVGCDRCPKTTVYLDGDHDGVGGETAFLVCDRELATLPTGLSVSTGDCADADPARHPGADEVCDEVDQDCDGEVDEGLAELRAWPDADGDGYGDLEAEAIEACALSEGLVDNASDCDDSDAATHPGALDTCGDGLDSDCSQTSLPCVGALPEAGVVLTGLAEQDYLGSDVVVGDLDGDGQEDLVLGARGLAPEVDGFEQGGAYLVYGPISSGPADQAGSQTAVLLGTEEKERAGWSVAAVDLDGDGADEVLVGARGGVASLKWAGLVYVLPGGERWDSGAFRDHALTIEGDSAYGRLGSGLTPLDDLDGDGVPELLVGASNYIHPVEGGERGAVYLLSGGDLEDGPVTDQAIRFLGDEAESELGARDSAQGDVDGDGVQDLVMGAHLAGDDAGRAYLLLGPHTADRDFSIDRPPSLVGTDQGARLGVAVAASDLDGDGYDDVLLGASGADQIVDGVVATGEVLLVPGGTGSEGWDGSEARSLATVVLSHTEAEAGLGASILVDDLDKDGALDVITGMPFVGDATPGGALGFLGPFTEGVLLDSAAELTLVREDGTGQTGDSLAVGGNLLGGMGPVLVMGASEESYLSETAAGAVFLVPLDIP